LAAKNGSTLEAYVSQVLEREARSGEKAIQGSALTSTEFEHFLNELAEGLPPLPSLPPNFSRADIYGEHP
jgi:hypothetical protein